MQTTWNKFNFIFCVVLINVLISTKWKYFSFSRQGSEFSKLDPQEEKIDNDTPVKFVVHGYTDFPTLSSKDVHGDDNKSKKTQFSFSSLSEQIFCEKLCNFKLFSWFRCKRLDVHDL